MSALSIRLLESLYKNAKTFALQEGISVNQLISSDLAEKLAILATQEYLDQRAAGGSCGAFDLALGLEPNTEPNAMDRK